MRFSILLAIIPLAAAVSHTNRRQSSNLVTIIYIFYPLTHFLQAALEARGNPGREEEAINECNAARAKCYHNSETDSDIDTCIEEWQVCIDSVSEDSPYCCKYPDGNDLPGFGTHN